MSLSGRDDTVVVDTAGWRGEHQARGAEDKYMREAPEAPVLTQERLRSLEGRDPMAAALLSVESSLPPSEDAPDPDSLAAKKAQAVMEKLTTAKVKAWRKAGGKKQGKRTDEGVSHVRHHVGRGVRSTLWGNIGHDVQWLLGMRGGLDI